MPSASDIGGSKGSIITREGVKGQIKGIMSEMLCSDENIFIDISNNEVIDGEHSIEFSDLEFNSENDAE